MSSADRMFYYTMLLNDYFDGMPEAHKVVMYLIEHSDQSTQAHRLFSMIFQQSGYPRHDLLEQFVNLIEKEGGIFYLTVFK